MSKFRGFICCLLIKVKAKNRLKKDLKMLNIDIHDIFHKLQYYKVQQVNVSDYFH